MTSPRDPHPAVAVVTGAAGFIGRHLVRRLVADGWRVRGVDRHPAQAFPESPEIEYHALDIRDAPAMAEAIRGADTVFHLASAHLELRAPRGWYESVNVAGVDTLVAACARQGVRRLVHASSVGVYGHVAHPPADEDAPKHPTSEYERTKLLGEQAALERAEREGVSLVVLRPGWVYGPGCPRTAKLLRTIRRGRFFYAGDGSNLRHPIYVADAVEAFLLAAQAPEPAAGRPYLIVGPRAVTVRELVETCARVQGVAAPIRRLPRPLVRALALAVEMGFRALGRQPPMSRRSLAFFEHDNAFTGRAAEERLGFRPRVELEEGLRATLAAL
ncbi:MAG: NAD-dependent epimerase/dehydratase family protein [Thermoanaerobaculia bacterium]